MIDGDFSNPSIQEGLSRKFKHVAATDVITPHQITAQIAPRAPPSWEPQKIRSILSGIARAKNNDEGVLLFSVPEFFELTDPRTSQKTILADVPLLKQLAQEFARETTLVPYSSAFVSVPYSWGIKRGVLCRFGIKGSRLSLPVNSLSAKAAPQPKPLNPAAIREILANELKKFPDALAKKISEQAYSAVWNSENELIAFIRRQYDDWQKSHKTSSSCIATSRVDKGSYYEINAKVVPDSRLSRQKQLKDCLKQASKYLPADAIIYSLRIFMAAANHNEYLRLKAVYSGIVKRYFSIHYLPLASYIAQAPLEKKRRLVEIEFTAFLPKQGQKAKLTLKYAKGLKGKEKIPYYEIAFENLRWIIARGLNDNSAPDFEKQATAAFEKIKAILDKEGLQFKDVVEQRNYMADIVGYTFQGKQHYQIFNDVRSCFYGDKPFDYPAATGIGMAGTRDLKTGGVIIDFIAIDKSKRRDIIVKGIKNILQVSAHEYSGKQLESGVATKRNPPKFQRAKVVIIPQGKVLYLHTFISGTASIRGEYTQHTTVVGALPVHLQAIFFEKLKELPESEKRGDFLKLAAAQKILNSEKQLKAAAKNIYALKDDTPGVKPEIFWDAVTADYYESKPPRGAIAILKIKANDNDWVGPNARRQTELTLDNIAYLISEENLMHPENLGSLKYRIGTSLDAVCRIRTYVKYPLDAESIIKSAGTILQKSASRNAPHSVVGAPVCRNGLVVEIEGEAVAAIPVKKSKKAASSSAVDLIRQIKDSRKDVSAAAIDGLVGIGEPIVSQLTEIALGNFSYHSRTSAIKALGQIRSAKAVPALIRICADENYYIVKAAMYALCLVGTKPAIEAVIKKLSVNDMSIQGHARECLALTGERGAMMLLKVLDREDWREETIGAIKALGNMGYRPAQHRLNWAHGMRFPIQADSGSRRLLAFDARVSRSSSASIVNAELTLQQDTVLLELLREKNDNRKTGYMENVPKFFSKAGFIALPFMFGEYKRMAQEFASQNGLGVNHPVVSKYAELFSHIADNMYMHTGRYACIAIRKFGGFTQIVIRDIGLGMDVRGNFVQPNHGFDCIIEAFTSEPAGKVVFESRNSKAVFFRRNGMRERIDGNSPVREGTRIVITFRLADLGANRISPAGIVVVPQAFTGASAQVTGKFQRQTGSSAADSGRKRKYRTKAGVDYGIYFMVMLDQVPLLLEGQEVSLKQADRLARKHSLFAHSVITVGKLFAWGERQGYLSVSGSYSVRLTDLGRQYFQERNKFTEDSLTSLPKRGSSAAKPAKNKEKMSSHRIIYPVWVNSDGRTFIGEKPEGKSWAAYTDIFQITHPHVRKIKFSAAKKRSSSPVALKENEKRMRMLLSKNDIELDRLIRKTVNPAGLPLAAIYGGAGVDVSHFFLSLDPGTGYFVSNYYGLALGDLHKVNDIIKKDFKELLHRSYRYRDFKRFSGFGLVSDISNKENIINSLAFELKALGLFEVEPFMYGKFPAMRFSWKHPDGLTNAKRKIVFFDADVTSPLRYPEELKKAISEKFHIYYQRAGLSIALKYLPRLESFIRFLYARMAPYGFFVTDDVVAEASKDCSEAIDMSFNFPLTNEECPEIAIKTEGSFLPFPLSLRSRYGRHLHIRQKLPVASSSSVGKQSAAVTLPIGMETIGVNASKAVTNIFPPAGLSAIEQVNGGKIP
ncbi:MAG: HEAT repeat domain-containing protein [Candidatus Omnitrophica bacterium]|nr:HEAT repeat domain-containing protein [Candidatus Omnitrophota bacterium]